MGNLKNNNPNNSRQDPSDFYSNVDLGRYEDIPISYPQRTVIEPEPQPPAPPRPTPSYRSAQMPSGGMRQLARQQEEQAGVVQPYAPQRRPAAAKPPKSRGYGLLMTLLLLLIVGLAVTAAYLAGLLPIYDGTVSDSSVVSDTAIDPVITNEDAPRYPIVHIEGIALPEDYGDGYMDPEAAFFVINQYRVINGLPELGRVDEATLQATLVRLSEISSEFSHTRPDGTKFSTVFSEHEVLYTHVSENLAEGQYTAEHVVSDWIASETHKTNLLDTNITHCSIVCGADANNMPIWVFHGINYADD